VLAEIEMVAPTNATVLINGETGVGKELVARSIHERSPRYDHAMVTVNCTAVPRDLFESEFFGHVRGAFSGALRDRMGRFLLADGGTLFLDEVGDLPLEMQPKLLRVLEEGEFEAVGDDTTHRIGVRIIAASNRDLEGAIRAGQFREDLYYRLNVFPIEVPPLRERKADIAILAVAFLEAACSRFHRICPVLTQGQLWQLSDYEWPGNVRELQNIVDRAVIKAPHGNLQFDVPNHPGGSAREQPPGDSASSGSCGQVAVVKADEMKRRERENLAAALRQCCGKIYGPGGAADLLGIPPTTLNARVKKLGLKDFKLLDGA
jgi:transcriptional regulator with GAF, ATPase, and Fis domain